MTSKIFAAFAVSGLVLSLSSAAFASDAKPVATTTATRDYCLKPMPGIDQNREFGKFEHRHLGLDNWRVGYGDTSVCPENQPGTAS